MVLTMNQRSILEDAGRISHELAVQKANEEYQKYPLITKKRLFYETMEDILPELKVIITDGNTQTLYPLESFSDYEVPSSSSSTSTSEGSN